MERRHRNCDIAPGAFSNRQGTYELEVTDNSPEPVEETPSVRVSNAEATEGDDAEIVFHVTLDRAASGPASTTPRATTSRAPRTTT